MSALELDPDDRRCWSSLRGGLVKSFVEGRVVERPRGGGDDPAPWYVEAAVQLPDVAVVSFQCRAATAADGWRQLDAFIAEALKS